MRTTLSLHFALRKPKNYLSGEMPIYLRVTVYGRRTELAVGRKCTPDRWVPLTGRVTGSKAISKTLNAFLDDVQFKFFELHRTMSATNENITAETIKSCFIGKSEKVRTLLSVFEDHNQKMKSLVGQEFAPSTLMRYKTACNHTASFIQWKYKTNHISIKDLNYEFVSQFAFWLKSVRKCGHNATMKYIGNLKKIVLECIKKDWLIKDPFAGFKNNRNEII
jgi:hypothetical protein